MKEVRLKVKVTGAEENKEQRKEGAMHMGVVHSGGSQGAGGNCQLRGPYLCECGIVILVS